MNPSKSLFGGIPLLLMLCLGCGTSTRSTEDTGTRETRNGAIALADIEIDFVQSDESCVLASYAIVASYFTKLPVSAYFKGYCRHFGIEFTDVLDAERQYSRHFDAEWQKRKCLGYEVILDLHSNSTETCFVEARRSFDAHFYVDSTKHLEELEQTLRTHESLLNITFHRTSGTHSVTVMDGGGRLLVRDTGRRGLHRIDSLETLGRLADCVIYVRK